MSDTKREARIEQLSRARGCDRQTAAVFVDETLALPDHKWASHCEFMAKMRTRREEVSTAAAPATDPATLRAKASADIQQYMEGVFDVGDVEEPDEDSDS